VAGGLILCVSLFAILGWIQPVFKKNERIEIPQSVQLILNQGVQTTKKKSAVSEAKKPDKREARPENVQRKPARVQRTLSVEPVAAQTRSRSSSLLKSISFAPSIGNSLGGGVGIAMDFTSDDQSVLEQAKELREYEERRRRIRGERGAGGRGDRGIASGGADGGIGGFDAGITPGDAAYLPAPKYPREAQKDQVEGWVKVRLLISVTGTVENFEIVAAQPTGYFEEAIKDVLPRWRYSPAVDEGGRPIEFWDEVTYQFKLEDAAL
jgi:TonB family protein